MINILLNLMGKIALLVALGYILRRREIITAQFQKDITDFMMKVALPANVLTTANNVFSRAAVQKPASHGGHCHLLLSLRFCGHPASQPVPSAE